MELEQLNRAWRSLDQRMDRQERLVQIDQYSRGMGKIRRSLRPVVWGQTLQALFGVIIVLVSASFWIDQREQGSMLMMLSGMLMQLYGTALIIGSALVLSRIGKLDYAAAVTTLARQLAEVRLAYVRTGMLAGLPWWILWIPAMAMLFKVAFGVDFYVNAPLSIAVSVVFGVFGLLATAWFHRYAQSPDRPRLKRWVERALSGESLTRARAELDGVAEFASDLRADVSLG